MTWAQRLKRVFDIDIETCSECGGDVCIIASIEDPAVIQKILVHLDDGATSATSELLPECPLRSSGATAFNPISGSLRPADTLSNSGIKLVFIV